MSYPVKLRVTGVVVDRPATKFTRDGAPRASFTVVVRSSPTAIVRRYRVVARGMIATFCDRYVVPGQRLQVEGTSLPRERFPRDLVAPAFEAVVLAQSVREVQQKARATVAPNPALAAAATREATPTADRAPVTSPTAAPLALAA